MNAVRTLLAALLVASSVSARAELVAGRDYSVLPVAQRGNDPQKIEVIEFFSYGCPHCYTLHEPIMKWAARQPSDVAFRRVAVGFGRSEWVSLGKAYYAFEATGDLARIDAPIFAAVHEQRERLRDERSLSDWLRRQNVNTARFSEAFNSFTVKTRMTQSEQMVVRYAVAAVPQVVVDGRFIAHGRTHDEMLGIADQLIAKARVERGKR